ncbi:MAG: MtrB/PioB family outer membrane beta-barrel protein [Pseudomonadota bacterium]
MRPQLDVTLDLERNRASGDVTTAGPGTGASAFPETSSGRDTVSLSLRSRRSDSVTVTGSLRYERLRGDDWALDGLSPDTLPGVLALGLAPPEHRVLMLTLGATVSFGRSPR